MGLPYVDASSKPTAGISRFWKATPAPIFVSSYPREKCKVTRLRTPGASGKALRVLIVEDDPALSENLSEILRGFGFQVSAVSSADRALEFLEQEHADCLLTDVRLPGQGGIAMLEELRRRHVTVPAIVMSGFVEPDHLRRATELGVIDVQSKPVNLERLHDVLDRLAS